MIKPIITYPNPILRKKSQDVVNFDKELHTLLDDMNDTMTYAQGVGLAAVQIGKLLNVLIINIPVEDPNDLENEIILEENLIEAINPKITHKYGEIVYKEGCLSIPDIHEEVTRAMNITIEYQTRDGKLCTVEANDFLAVAWQHEMEHLNGHVFIDNLSFMKRKKFEKDWKKKLKEAKKNRDL
jgi:peptide deformylase